VIEVERHHRLMVGRPRPRAGPPTLGPARGCAPRVPDPGVARPLNPSFTRSRLPAASARRRRLAVARDSSCRGIRAFTRGPRSRVASCHRTGARTHASPVARDPIAGEGLKVSELAATWTEVPGRSGSDCLGQDPRPR
jgi:hypothetical protein